MTFPAEIILMPGNTLNRCEYGSVAGKYIAEWTFRRHVFHLESTDLKQKEMVSYTTLERKKMEGGKKKERYLQIAVS